MKEFFTFDEIELAAKAVQKRLHYKPRVGLILGSGLGDMADTIENPDIIPFKDIANWPEATAPGHVGRLVVGKLENQEVLVGEDGTISEYRVQMRVTFVLED